jgi:4-amino-4-deoxy-L-arabinose transferase-like glycosyltransferase
MPAPRPVWLWLLLTLGVSAGFVRVAGRGLGDFRPVSNDEVELLEVAYKLATQGVLGSDMYAGFFGAEQHHLWTLPLQHVLDAASFHLLGPGVASARWVSVGAAVCLIWVVGWLGWRWYGLLGAIVGELLLTIWPSNLIGAQTTLPLLGVARAARYDVLAVASIWLAMAVLDSLVRRSGRPFGRAVALGVCGGLATLAQFFGAFVWPLVGVAWLWTGRWRRDRLTVAAWSVAGALVVLGPWALYVATYRADLAGQLSVYGAARGDFGNVAFYVNNVRTEPERFTHLLQSSGGQLSEWLLLVGALPAAAYVAWRTRHSSAIGDRLLLVSLLTLSASLLLLDQTKTALYAILLLPSICLALAASARGALDWARCRGYWARLAVSSLTASVLLGLGLDGLAAYQVDRTEAAQVSPYLAVGEQIEAALAPGARLLGPERWWWALHRHPYVSLRSTWFQWSARASSTSSEPDYMEWVQAAQPDNVLVNDNTRNDLRAFPVALQAQFWTFVDQCTTLVGTVDDPSYGRTDIYRLHRPPASTCR